MTNASATSPLDDSEVLCVACGYSLRGLAADGECPECGVPVERSLGGNRLTNAEPAWLARLTRGQGWLSVGVSILAWTTTIGLIAMILLPVVLISIQSRAGNFLTVAFLVLSIGGTTLVIAGLIVSTVGGFLVTSLEPRETLRESSTSVRQIVRWSLVAAIGVIVVGTGLQSFGPLAKQWWMQAATVFSAIAALVMAIGSLMQWLSRLAERIPDSILRRETLARRKELCGTLIAIALLQIATGVLGAMQTPAPGPPTSSWSIQRIANCFGGVLMLWLLILLGRFSKTMRTYRKRFRDCRKEAEARGITSSPTQFQSP